MHPLIKYVEELPNDREQRLKHRDRFEQSYQHFLNDDVHRLLVIVRGVSYGLLFATTLFVVASYFLEVNPWLLPLMLVVCGFNGANLARKKDLKELWKARELFFRD